METIGLIAAMPLESSAFLRCIKDWKQIAMNARRGTIFMLPGKTCVLVTSGMGVRRASEAATSLVEEYSPSMLISFGIAGAVEANLEIGDVVLAEAVYQLDHGDIGPRSMLKPWPEVLWEVAVRTLAGRGRHLFRGTAVTTSGSQVSADKLEGMQHPILEMETAGIAQVAADKGIPLLSLRAISDGPCAPIPFDLGEVMDEDANLRAGRLIKVFLRHPRIIFQSMQMRRNANLAADYAAIALIAALSQENFGTLVGGPNE